MYIWNKEKILRKIRKFYYYFVAQYCLDLNKKLWARDSYYKHLISQSIIIKTLST